MHLAQAPALRRRRARPNPFPTTCTLAYTITAQNVTAAALSAAMAAVPCYSNALTDPAVFGLFNSTITSDTQGIVSQAVTRTIVITLGAGFFLLFPTAAAWAPVFNGFYKSTLTLALVAVVGETAPVFA